MNSLIYAGVILFGAITLVIEARRNYSVSAKHHPFAFYGILEHLQAQHLCSPRDWNFGFYIYSLLYLVSYAILLSSTELVELIYNSSVAANLVGATDTTLGPSEDPFDLSGTDYGKPLFISAFIIAFYSVGATRNIELHIRTLSHRLAGVPRGVYQVLDRLQRPEFLSETAPPTGPLMASFRDKLKGLQPEEFAPRSIDDLLAVSQLPLEPVLPRREPGNTQSAGLFAAFFAGAGNRHRQIVDDNRPKGKEQYLFDICKALRVIDLLRPAIVGGQRATHFPLLGMKELGDISKSLEVSIGRPDNKRRVRDESPKTLHDEINEFRKYDEASLERLREKAIEVANSARAVFAVYFICNSRTVLNVDRQSALHKVRAFADRGYKVEQNSFAGALFAATIISAFSGFILLQNYAQLEANRYPFLMAEEIFAELHPEQVFWSPEECETLDQVGMELCVAAFEEQPGDKTEGVYLLDQVASDAPIFSLYRNRYRDCANIVYSKFDKDWITRKNRAVPASWPDSEQPPKGVSKGYADRCMAAKSQGWLDFRKKRKPVLQRTVFFDVLSVLLMVAAVVQMSIFEKEIRMDQNAWRPWTLNRIPYVRYLTGAILPTIAGVIALCIGYVLRLIWSANFDVTISQIEFLFVDNWQFFIAYSVPCYFLAISIFVLIDKHDHWRFVATFGFAVLAAAVHVLLVWLVPLTTYDFVDPIDVKSFWNVLWDTRSLSAAMDSDGFFLTSKEARDAWSFCLLPVSFLLIFAVFVEISEDVAPRIQKALKTADPKDASGAGGESAEPSK